MDTFKNIILHLGDCMEVLRSTPDKAFNLAIVDPPYYSGPERRQFYGCRNSAIGVKRLYAKSEKWIVPGKEYFTELERVAEYYIVWGCNYFDYHFAPGRIVWISATAAPHSLTAKLPQQTCSHRYDCSLSCGMECVKEKA